MWGSPWFKVDSQSYSLVDGLHTTVRCLISDLEPNLELKPNS